MLCILKDVGEKPPTGPCNLHNYNKFYCFVSKLRIYNIYRVMIASEPSTRKIKLFAYTHFKFKIIIVLFIEFGFNTINQVRCVYL